MTHLDRGESVEKKQDTKHLVIIESNGVNKSKITIDGVDLSEAVTEIRFVHKGGQLPVMEITLAQCDISISNPRIPQLPEVFRTFYRAVD